MQPQPSAPLSHPQWAGPHARLWQWAGHRRRPPLPRPRPRGARQSPRWTRGWAAALRRGWRPARARRARPARASAGAAGGPTARPAPRPRSPGPPRCWAAASAGPGLRRHTDCLNMQTTGFVNHRRPQSAAPLRCWGAASTSPGLYTPGSGRQRTVCGITTGQTQVCDNQICCTTPCVLWSWSLAPGPYQ